MKCKILFKLYENENISDIFLYQTYLLKLRENILKNID